jgi:diguanylate cyclase (GGDEF)-like protein
LQGDPAYWCAAFEVVSEPIFAHDPAGRILRANAAYAARAGCTVDELAGRFYWHAFPRLAGPVAAFDAATGNATAVADLQLEDGSRWSISAFARGGRGSGRITLCVLREPDAVVHKLNRSLHLLGACSSALVRAEDESALLAEMCRLIVELGEYRLVWAGYARHDDAKSLEIAARAGADCDRIEPSPLTWSETAAGAHPAADAIRGRRAVLVGNLDSDNFVAPWRQAALSCGCTSCLALPVASGKRVYGALVIYATSAHAFDAAEVALLEQLANDLGFGIAGLREAAERKRLEEELDYQHNFDNLTGLANRHLFEERLARDLIHAGRSGRSVAVVRLDLDRFQMINDGAGNGTGDALLIDIGRRLSHALREGDTVARFAGDEFALSLVDVADADEVDAIARRLQTVVAQPMDVAGRPLSVSASIGISLAARDGNSVEQLLKHAEHAMVDAKALGGNVFRFYAPEMNERAGVRFALEMDLRRAIERDELVVHYQPKVSLSSGEVTGAEVLVRWQHPQRGLVMPNDFIPLAESTGLIKPLGEWVLHAVCSQIRSWSDAGASTPILAVNLSARQFHDDGLVATVEQSLTRHRLEPTRLEIEITESVLMGDLGRAVATLGDLRTLGLKLSLDDFGTGYSSLSYLKRFPIDFLKVDRAFIENITTDPDDAAICVAIINLAHNLKLQVVAEGVETGGQMNYLRRHRCDHMQGFFFSRPMDATDFRTMIDTGRVLELPQPEGPVRTLLLVDDEPSILSALKRQLRGGGYRILTAASAREALELLATEDVQVVLSDQRMAEMSGTEFLERVRQLHPHTIRIVLSGYTDLKTLTDAINRGAIYKFLTKPWEPEMLTEHIREAFLHHEAGQRSWH